MVVILNGHISLKKIDWDLIFWKYLIKSPDAFLKPILKGQSVLFILVTFLYLK